MKVVINPTLFKQYLDILKGLEEEGVLVFTPDGLQSMLVDASNVAMAKVFLPKEDFIGYDINTEIQVAISFGILYPLISGTKEPVTIDIEPEKLTISSGFRQTEMKTLVMSTVRTPPARLPPIEYTTVMTMPTQLLRDVTQSMKNDPYILLHSTAQGELEVTADNDNTKSRALIPAEEIETTEIEDDSALFSADYLPSLIKSLPGKMLKISMHTNFPLKMETSIGVQTGYVVTMIAPRIDSS